MYWNYKQDIGGLSCTHRDLPYCCPLHKCHSLWIVCTFVAIPAVADVLKFRIRANMVSIKGFE